MNLKKPSIVIVRLFHHMFEVERLRLKLTKDIPLDSDQYRKINDRLIKYAVIVNNLLEEFDNLFVSKSK